MSSFRAHSRSLAGGYVFYERLLTDGYYPILGRYVSYAANRVGKQTRKYSHESKQVRRLAKAEIAKEKKMLEEVFGVTIDTGYYLKGASRGAGFKEVIDAFNELLNLKRIYERNKKLIQNTKGQKGVFSWYPTYFMKAWQAEWPNIKKAVERRFEKGISLEIALQEVLDKKMPAICVDGIKRMLDGPEVENSRIDPKLKDAYKDLTHYIGEVETENSFANQIYKTYKLDELKKALVKELKGTSLTKLSAAQLKPTVRKNIEYNIHKRGGFTLEAVENAVFQQIGEAIGGVATHVGQKGIKADNILTLSIDQNLIEETLATAGSTRRSHEKAFNELGKKLQGLEKGFIIYSSDKNYSLNDGFRGYSVGDDMRAKDFLDLVYRDSEIFMTLLGAINQLGEGALLEDDRSNFERLLAQDIAYMLFDDYTTIGEKDIAGRAIHVMNLNGILIPLSLILTLLADAIEEMDESKAKGIVNVKIEAPKILWERQEDQWLWQETYAASSTEAWETQRSYALNMTYITARFLRKFKELIINQL